MVVRLQDLRLFDKHDQLHIVSNAGTISKSNFSLHVSNSEPNNPVAARRFGLTNSDGVFAQTLFQTSNKVLKLLGMLPETMKLR